MHREDERLRAADTKICRGGEIKKLDPDVIVPMHCSGENVIREVRAQMSDKLLVPATGAPDLRRARRRRNDSRERVT